MISSQSEEAGWLHVCTSMLALYSGPLLVIRLETGCEAKKHVQLPTICRRVNTTAVMIMVTHAAKVTDGTRKLTPF